MANSHLVVLGDKSCDSGEIRNALPATPSKAAEFSGNVCFVTLGCAKNQVDSEIMLGAFRKKGFRAVPDPEQAEVIVVNTCAFLQSAVKEGIDRILELARFKEEGRCRRLVVAGCMVERYRDELQKEFPEVDRFVSTDELLDVAEEGSTTAACLDGARRPYFLYDETMPRMLSTGSHFAYVKISEGCNRPCSFCIIPKIRGSFRSRARASIVEEARELIENGVKELNFVAQDLTAYGSDFETNRGVRSELPELLNEISLLPGDFWVRLLYAYPIGVTEELITQIVSSPRICNYLDLPLQHISNGVLKRMNRPLGEKGTRNLIEMIKKIAPDLHLRTTFIVGFPGETKEDVEILSRFVSEGYFTHVGVFSYSQEEEAKSFHFENQVEKAEREERRSQVMLAQQAVVEKHLSAYLGKSIQVLVEGAHSDTDLLLVGRSEWQAPETDGEVIINDFNEVWKEEGQVEKLQGSFGTVEITEVAGYDLVGRLNNLST